MRLLRPAVKPPCERWAMDFAHGTLADGRTIRALAVVDVFTRECIVLEARPRFSGHDVAMVLSAAGARDGLPATIQVDNGSEFTSAGPKAGARSLGLLGSGAARLQPSGQAHR